MYHQQKVGIPDMQNFKFHVFRTWKNYVYSVQYEFWISLWKALEINMASLRAIDNFRVHFCNLYNTYFCTAKENTIFYSMWGYVSISQKYNITKKKCKLKILKNNKYLITKEERNNFQESEWENYFFVFFFYEDNFMLYIWRFPQVAHIKHVIWDIH